MFEPILPFETDRLSLRQFTLDDLDALHRLQSLPAVVKYLYWDQRSRAEVAEVLRERIRQTGFAAEGDVVTLAVALKETGRIIGDVNLKWVSAKHQQGETGFVLLPEYHGKGYAYEAASAMIALGFHGLGLHRIVGRCDARNDASARLMERLGMRREAHLRENEKVKGEWTDELIYAILAEEWRGETRSTERD